MERLGKPLVKIMPRQYSTLLGCVFASFKANGPMTNEELYRSLPYFKKSRIKKAVAELPDELTGR